MQATEGLTILIQTADERLKLNSTYGTEAPEFSKDEEQLILAVSICQAMLNTALPIARFRCFVRVESGRDEGREYTVCAVNIEDIMADLHLLSLYHRNVYVSLWEQRPTGADMIEAYQGKTNNQFTRLFVPSLIKYSSMGLAN